MVLSGWVECSDVSHVRLSGKNAAVNAVDHVQANSAHIRQSRPDPGLGFQAQVIQPAEVVPASLGSRSAKPMRLLSLNHVFSEPCRFRPCWFSATHTHTKMSSKCQTHTCAQHTCPLARFASLARSASLKAQGPSLSLRLKNQLKAHGPGSVTRLQKRRIWFEVRGERPGCRTSLGEAS